MDYVEEVGESERLLIFDLLECDKTADCCLKTLYRWLGASSVARVVTTWDTVILNVVFDPRKLEIKLLVCLSCIRNNLGR